jgi:hypothetical protein
MRQMVRQKLYLGWPSWLQASRLPRHLGDTAPSPGELIANDCFGRVAEHERLALEGLIAGEPCSAQPTGAEPPDQDPTEPVA